MGERVERRLAAASNRALAGQGPVAEYSRGLTFFYIDYGDLDRLYLELCYSLSTLRYWKFRAPVDVVIYTDKPGRYRDLPVRIVDIASKIKEFSLNELYHH